MANSAIGIDEDRRKRGDKAATRDIAAFGSVLDSNTRVSDICSRYEDNLFVCLLPRTGNGGAFSYALRVRKAVEQSGLRKGTGITVSGGVAAYMPEMNQRSDLIAAAREALDAAIGEGRNRVMVCVPASAEDEDDRAPVASGWSIDEDQGASEGDLTDAEEVEPDAEEQEATAATGANGVRTRSAPVKTSLVALSRRRRR